MYSITVDQRFRFIPTQSYIDNVVTGIKSAIQDDRAVRYHSKVILKKGCPFCRFEEPGSNQLSLSQKLQEGISRFKKT